MRQRPVPEPGDGEARIEARHRRVWTPLETYAGNEARTDVLEEAVRLVSDTVDHWSRPRASHAAGLACAILAELTGRAGPPAHAARPCTGPRRHRRPRRRRRLVRVHSPRTLKETCRDHRR
ncbi:hypothetical protein QWU11_14765 [Actinomadura sp. DC4]|nr:hypothetical protein [Actinomadura sp. DC4]